MTWPTTRHLKFNLFMLLSVDFNFSIVFEKEFFHFFIFPAILQEMAVYLKPLEIPNVFTYDMTSIQALVKLLHTGLEFISTFPGKS
jgi:hypothetical protein